MNPSDAQGLGRAADEPSLCLASITGLRDMAVKVLFLGLATPDHPVKQVTGRITEVDSGGLLLALDRPLPRLEHYIRFGVEVFSHSGLWEFQALSLEPVESGAVNLHLALPQKVRRIQRRRFARVPFSGEILYQLMRDGKPGSTGNKGLCVDLSASGVKMVTQRPLRQDDELLVSFVTPDNRAHRGIFARVVRADLHAGNYIAACCFQAMNESQVMQLVQSVFYLQLRSAGR